MSLLLYAKQIPTAPVIVKVNRSEGDDESKRRRQRIRCPKCTWQPRTSSRWRCLPRCGHVWNTFDTRGRCPACQHQWRETACPACQQMSPHEDWYENGGSRSAS